MASTRNPDGLRLQGFTAGVNNVSEEQDLPNDEFGHPMALRAAINVDLVGIKKKPRIRAGYLRKLAGNVHSPATIKKSSTMFAVVNGDLNAYDASLALIATVRHNVGLLYLSYAEINGDLYWSSPTEFRRIRGVDLADTPGWVDSPGTPTLTATTGALAAGTYRVACTWLDAEGRESGAIGVAELELPTGGGLLVKYPPAPETAVTVRTYVSPPDSEELYATNDASTVSSNGVVGAVGDGKALETLWLQPLPPCAILRYGHGRLFGANGNLLVWSDALRFGLTTHDNYMRLGNVITLLEPIGEGESGSGVFVADHKNTYWMDGPTPDKWSRKIVYGHSAIPGTSIRVPGHVLGLDAPGPIVAWLSSNGVFCAGLPGGQVQPITSGKLALPDGIRGAVMHREGNGLRQLVMSYLSTDSNRLAIGDSASASVTRYP